MRRKRRNYACHRAYASDPTAATIAKLPDLPPWLRNYIALDPSRPQRGVHEELTYTLCMKSGVLSEAYPADELCHLPLRLYDLYLYRGLNFTDFPPCDVPFY